MSNLRVANGRQKYNQITAVAACNIYMHLLLSVYMNLYSTRYWKSRYYKNKVTHILCCTGLSQTHQEYFSIFC